MTVQVGQTQSNLDTNRWYAYSGVVIAGAAAPATLTLIDIPNIGLTPQFISIQPSFGTPITNNAGTALGLSINIDGIEVYKNYFSNNGNIKPNQAQIQLLIPAQSSLEIFSLNTAGNTLQERGVTVLGWQ